MDTVTTFKADTVSQPGDWDASTQTSRQSPASDLETTAPGATQSDTSKIGGIPVDEAVLAVDKDLFTAASASEREGPSPRDMRPARYTWTGPTGLSLRGVAALAAMGVWAPLTMELAVDISSNANGMAEGDSAEGACTCSACRFVSSLTDRSALYRRIGLPIDEEVVPERSALSSTQSKSERTASDPAEAKED